MPKKIPKKKLSKKKTGPKRYEKLSKEKLDIAPYGKASCPLCRLNVDDLRHLHNLKFRKKYTLQQLRDYLKAYHDISPDWNHMSKHFNEHTTQTEQTNLVPKSKQQIVEVMDDLPKDVKRSAGEEVQAAYDKLTKMCNSYAELISKVADSFDLDQDKVANHFKNDNPLKSLEMLGKLHREARDMVKDITALRAPKVIVSQFLESTINEVIMQTGAILSDLCKDIEVDLTAQIKKEEKGPELKETFAKSFRKIGLEYKKEMIALKRDQLGKANAALADLEKII